MASLAMRILSLIIIMPAASPEPLPQDQPDTHPPTDVETPPTDVETPPPRDALPAPPEPSSTPPPTSRPREAQPVPTETPLPPEPDSPSEHTRSPLDEALCDAPPAPPEHAQSPVTRCTAASSLLQRGSARTNWASTAIAPTPSCIRTARARPAAIPHSIPTRFADGCSTNRPPRPRHRLRHLRCHVVSVPSRRAASPSTRTNALASRGLLLQPTPPAPAHCTTVHAPCAPLPNARCRSTSTSTLPSFTSAAASHMRDWQPRGGERRFLLDRPAAAVGAVVCAFASCDREPTNCSLFCSRAHAYAHNTAAPLALPVAVLPVPPPESLRCALPSCNALVYVDDRPGYTATCCSVRHHQLHLALLRMSQSPPAPRQPGTHAAAYASTSAPARRICAIQSCQEFAFVDVRPGLQVLCCSNRHHLLHVALLNTPQCSLAECTTPVLIVADTSTVHEDCGYEHALLARDRGEVCFSQDRPIAPVARGNQCLRLPRLLRM